MQTKCKLCHGNIDKNSPNYIFNNNCKCSFHFECYDKHFPNYFSIYFPKCPYCNQHYRKEELSSYENINYDEAFEIWIGKPKNNILCQEQFCFQLSKEKFINLCEKHFFNKFSQNNIIQSLKLIFIYGIGLPPNKKLKLYKQYLHPNPQI